MAWTYILRCADGSFYVGSTTDLDGRIWQHNHSPNGAAYTRRRRPVTLAWAAEFNRIDEAFAFEKRIQGWSRAKREALIRGDFGALPGLSRRDTFDRDPESTAGGFEAVAAQPHLNHRSAHRLSDQRESARSLGDQLPKRRSRCA